MRTFLPQEGGHEEKAGAPYGGFFLLSTALYAKRLIFGTVSCKLRYMSFFQILNIGGTL